MGVVAYEKNVFEPRVLYECFLDTPHYATSIRTERIDSIELAVDSGKDSLGEQSTEVLRCMFHCTSTLV